MDSDYMDTNPYMSPSLRRERLKFAVANQDRDCSKVIFSDQKILQNDIRTGHEFIGIWGCISQTGHVEMTFVSNHFDSEEYIEILNTMVVPSILNNHGGFQNVAFYQVILFLIQQIFRSNHNNFRKINQR